MKIPPPTIKKATPPHDIYGGRYQQYPNKDKILYIRKDQILGDIDASLEIVALTHRDDTGGIMPVLERPIEHFRNLFDRWINKYIDNSKQRMQAYVVEPMRKATMNAAPDWEEKEIHLSFPWYWDETTFGALSGAVHDYIVNSVLMEFLAMSITSKDPITTDKQSLAQEAYDNIKHYCVTTLPGTMRKKLHPF